MQKVLQVAEKAGARVVLVGDTAQNEVVEGGAPVRSTTGGGEWLRRAWMRFSARKIRC